MMLQRFIKRISNLIDGDFAVKNIKLPKATALGILGVVFLYGSVAGLFSLTQPLSPTGDTAQHLDYVWRISKGEIPNRKEGITYPPFVERSGYRQQQQAAHPPLFYVLHSPLVANLMNDGNWPKAMMVGRGLNVIFGVLAVLALAWAGWVFGRKRGPVFAVSVPAVSVLVYRFVRLNFDYSLDALLVLFTTLSLAISYKIIVLGPKKKFILATIVLSLLGMSTKVPYIVFLGINLAAIIVSIVLHSKEPLKRKIVKGLVVSGGIFTITALAIGWFYYLWNYAAEGKWHTARLDDYTGGRTPKTAGDVLTNKNLWRLFYGNLSKYVTLSVAITSFSVAGFFTLTKHELKKIIKNRSSATIVVLMAAAVLGVFATQLEHAVGVGAINFRYMLPAILAFGLFITFGLLRFEWTRGQLVAVAAILMAGSSLYARANTQLNNLYSDALLNGVPELLVTALLIFFIVGAIALSVSLFSLTKPGYRIRPSLNVR